MAIAWHAACVATPKLHGPALHHVQFLVIGHNAWLAVGLTVGDDVDEAVGLPVGLAVGNAVGLAVGVITAVGRGQG